MNQFVLALLIKLKDRHSDRSDEIIEMLSKESPNWESNVNWLKKTGALEKRFTELMNLLKPEDRIRLIIDLFKTLYPRSIVNKHPSENAYLFVLGEHKLFYKPLERTLTMNLGDDEPRVFSDKDFLENLPKIKDFLSYLDVYSKRNRKRFSSQNNFSQ